MKRYLIPTAVALAFAGSAQAQDVAGALNNAVTGLQATGTSFLSGQVEATAGNFTNTVTGLGVDLAAGTPGEALAATGVQTGNTLVDAGGPLYAATEAPASQLAELGAPVTDLLIDAINTTDGIPGLDGLDGLPALPGLPGADALSVDNLPLDTLDPTVVTGLLDGAPLPGLPGAL